MALSCYPPIWIESVMRALASAWGPAADRVQISNSECTTDKSCCRQIDSGPPIFRCCMPAVVAVCLGQFGLVSPGPEWAINGDGCPVALTALRRIAISSRQAGFLGRFEQGSTRFSTGDPSSRTVRNLLKTREVGDGRPDRGCLEIPSFAADSGDGTLASPITPMANVLRAWRPRQLTGPAFQAGG
jgi:hypothetical protein